MSLCSQYQISGKRVGPFHTTRKFDFKSFLQLPFQSKIIRKCIPTWQIWLIQKVIAPLVNRVPVHKKTTNCCTWSLCVTDGWFISPDLEHYRYVECYIISTHRTRIADTVEFISTVIHITKKNSEDYLHKYITDTIALLEDPNPTVPSLSFGDDTKNPVKQIETLLNRAIPVPKSIKTTLTPPSPHTKFPS